MVKLDGDEETVEECCGSACYTQAYIELLNDMHALVEAHEWQRRDGLPVCRRCGVVRNREHATSCRGALPVVQTRDGKG